MSKVYPVFLCCICERLSTEFNVSICKSNKVVHCCFHTLNWHKTKKVTKHDVRMAGKMAEVFREMHHYKETKIPRCLVCKKPLKHAIDSKTGKLSEYSWESACEHGKGVLLSIG